MKKSIVRGAMAAVATVAMAFGLAACGGDGGNESTPEGDGGNETSEEVAAPEGESEEFMAYLTEAVDVVNAKIAEVGAPMQQIMLASDVSSPEQKYGMWVMPFQPDKAVVEKFISTIQITDGTDFVVTLTSAETGKMWTMDQDGTATELEG